MHTLDYTEKCLAPALQKKRHEYQSLVVCHCCQCITQAPLFRIFIFNNLGVLLLPDSRTMKRYWMLISSIKQHIPGHLPERQNNFSWNNYCGALVDKVKQVPLLVLLGADNLLVEPLQLEYDVPNL